VERLKSIQPLRSSVSVNPALELSEAEAFRHFMYLLYFITWDEEGIAPH
jgi:hypothetical protein